MTPLRQFDKVPSDVIRKAEGKQFVSALLIDGTHGIDARLMNSRGIAISIW
jgi:hypothetical protein